MNYPKLIDTHCHINTMIKPTFDVPLAPSSLPQAQSIVDEAQSFGVSTIINVGTSLIESNNCIFLARHFPQIFASIGIHPNDCSATWFDDFKEIKTLAKKHTEHKIVAIGECGLDRHYPDFNIERQIAAFKAQIELALEHDLALIVHTRDAYDETLAVLEEYKESFKRGVIHCFSEDLNFAQMVTAWNFHIGLGGTITYPKNDALRTVATALPLTTIVLETDAPFLPIQSMRGKKNHPQYIHDIAQFLALLRGIPLEDVTRITTHNAQALFKLV